MQSVSFTVASRQRDSISLRSQKESGAQSGTKSLGISSASLARAFMSVSIASNCRHLLVQKELSLVVASLSIHSARASVVSVSSRSSPVPPLAPV